MTDLLIICEGPSDRDALKVIAERLDCYVETAIIEGGFNAKKANAIFQTQSPERAIYVKDTECSGRGEYKRAVNERLKDLNNCIEFICIECALEAWFLADGSAIESVTGRNESYSDPSVPNDPDDKINEIFKKQRGYKAGYTKPRDAPEFANEIDMDLVAEKCASFHEFKVNLAG